MKTKYLFLLILLLAGLTSCRKHVKTTIEGNVIDNQSNPVPDATVEMVKWAMDKHGEYFPEILATQTTNAGGNFDFGERKLETSSTYYTLSVSKDEYIPDERYGELPIKEDTKENIVQLVLDPEATLALRLTNTQNIYEKIIVQLANEASLNSGYGFEYADMIIGYNIDTVLYFLARRNQYTGMTWSLSLQESSTSSSEEYNDTIYISDDSSFYTINY